MEKYYGFENWLKANGYKTWNTYLGFMRQIEKDLDGIDLEKINSATNLNQVRKELQGKTAFMLRSTSDKSNILSGFKTYIDYVEQETKK